MTWGLEFGKSSKVETQEFPREEYALRYKRARQLMERKNLDAIFVHETNNYRYFSGASFVTKNRPSFFALPEEGDPILIMNLFGKERAEIQSWIKELRTYSDPFDFDSVTKVLKDAGLAKATIGAEIDDPFFGSFYALKIRDKMADAEFVDASDIIWKLRMEKTEREVDCIRRACDITSNAFDRIFETVHEGMKENEISEAFYHIFVDFGSPGAGFAMNSGLPYPIGGTEKPLRRGDLLWFDAFAVFKGYYCDFARVGVVGKPSDKQKRRWEHLQKIVQSGVEAIAPGDELSKVIKAAIKTCKSLGIDPALVQGVGAPRRHHIGHGVGLDAVELPSMLIKNNMPMRPGMVLTVEPAIIDQSGVYHLEEDVLVTEDGHEILSKASTDIYEIR